MKILICSKCGKKQSTGKFCLDDGSLLKEIIDSKIKFMPIITKRTSEQLKRDIRNWLARIGIQQTDIKISSQGVSAFVEYKYSGKVYIFSSNMQNNITNNLAGIEIFLHGRIIGIERGIETTEQAFSGYESLPDFTSDENPYVVLGVNREQSLDIIRSRFKELAKKFHPDVNNSVGADLQFQRIKKALDKIELERLE